MCNHHSLSISHLAPDSRHRNTEMSCDAVYRPSNGGENDTNLVYVKKLPKRKSKFPTQCGWYSLAQRGNRAQPLREVSLLLTFHAIEDPGAGRVLPRRAHSVLPRIKTVCIQCRICEYEYYETPESTPYDRSIFLNSQWWGVERNLGYSENRGV